MTFLDNFFEECVFCSVLNAQVRKISSSKGRLFFLFRSPPLPSPSLAQNPIFFFFLSLEKGQEYSMCLYILGIRSRSSVAFARSSRRGLMGRYEAGRARTCENFSRKDENVLHSLSLGSDMGRRAGERALRIYVRVQQCTLFTTDGRCKRTSERTPLAGEQKRKKEGRGE